MNVKTITAPTIHAALIEARRTLGDDVVLMESIPAQDGEPARITVMADASGRTPRRSGTPAIDSNASIRSNQARSAAAPGVNVSQPRRPALVAAGAVDHAGYGYSKTNATSALPSEESARQAERPSARSDGPSPIAYPFDVGGRTLQDVAGEPIPPHVGGRGASPVSDPEPRREGMSRSAGRGSIFPNRRELVDASALPVQSGAMETIEKLITAQLKLLHDRLDTLERRFGGAIIGAAQAWIANPVYANLLYQGLRPASITKIFDGLARKGYSPDTDPETLKWAVAQEFRRSLDVSAPAHHGGAQVFIGPSGAGKTSLLLKLACHPGFFGRRETAVIVIEPEHDEALFHHSTVDLFRKHGLPVQSVRTADEMRKAIERVQRFEHILIDTPPLPLQHAVARKMLAHVKRLVGPIMPLRVQFVLNATRSIEDFDRGFVHRLALRPDVIALTHLDETGGWGRLCEWLMAVEMPVQFVSTGAAVPDGVAAFSPTWFIEEMMKL